MCIYFSDKLNKSMQTKPTKYIRYQNCVAKIVRFHLFIKVMIIRTLKYFLGPIDSRRGEREAGKKRMNLTMEGKRAF